MADTLICRSCGNTGRMFTGKSCVCRYGRAIDESGKVETMADDDMPNFWPEGTHRADIRCLAAPRLALLSGDATPDQDKQFGNTQIVDAQHIRDSREHDVIAAVEEHMVIEVMLAIWRDGYWPRKPIMVRWFVMKDVGLGAAGRLAWVERESER